VKNAICVVAQCACAISEIDVDGHVMEDVCGDPIGRVHKSVVGSFPPSNMMLLSHQTVHLCLLNRTSHPASVRL
jgi:hypothetical protein